MYITIADLQTLIPEAVLTQLSNDNPQAVAVNTAIVEMVIKDACELIDGYLYGRYSLPLSNQPSLIAQIAKELARYQLYARRPEGFELPPAVEAGYKNSIKLLEKIRDGLVSIGIVDTGKLMADDGEFRARVRRGRGQLDEFSRDTLSKY